MQVQVTMQPTVERKPKKREDGLKTGQRNASYIGL